MTQYCSCCGQPFEPRQQTPQQRFCSTPACQRARKRQWQREKLLSDPDYRCNQLAAQHAWKKRNQDYWRTYHTERKSKQSAEHLKMDVSTFTSGVYRITKIRASSRDERDSWIVKITPLFAIPPYKMDG